MVTARANTILSRFPRHLDVRVPGKLVGTVVDGLAAGLDVKTSQLGRVRTAHRLGAADEDRDLYLLAGLHGLRAGEFELLTIRRAAIERLRADLADVDPSPAALGDAGRRLRSLLGVVDDVFAPFPDEADAAPALARLRLALGELVGYPAELGFLRGQIRDVIRLHRHGNGTVAALLEATGAYLGLDLEGIDDDPDGYWHVAGCSDRFRLRQLDPPGSMPPERLLDPEPDVIALEENPFEPKEIEPIDRRHGDRFRVLRKGFDPVDVTVRVGGIGDRTVQPMVVNIDSGHGLVYTRAVPDGEELRFGSDGRVTLSGAEVGRFCYCFDGGVFADRDAPHSRDFVFADGPHDDRERVATFAVTAPRDDAFDADAGWPHAEGVVTPASLVVGETRWAFFVRSAAYGSTHDSAPVPAVPNFAAGVFDGSVFAPGAADPPSGRVGFAWQEREAFALTVWIPARFAALDRDGEPAVTERLRLRLDRHRAAGIHVYVKYASDLWDLSAGILRGSGSTAARGVVVVGTRLWPDGTVQPEPV